LETVQLAPRAPADVFLHRLVRALVACVIPDTGIWAVRTALPVHRRLPTSTLVLRFAHNANPVISPIRFLLLRVRSAGKVPGVLAQRNAMSVRWARFPRRRTLTIASSVLLIRFRTPRQRQVAKRAR
jgi:hypothetical protein